MSEKRERLQKVMAAAGFGSRRGCEEIITAGRVFVNGTRVTKLGATVFPLGDEILVDGRPLKAEPHVYFVVNKPKGYLCTNRDEYGRPLVVNLIDRCPQRIYTVGRLDEDTEGVILVTNDGEMANKIAHPSHKVSKIYLAKIRGHLSNDELEQLRKGIHFSDGLFKPHSVNIRRTGRAATTVLIHMKEGRNREIRRLFARIDHPVLSLKRERIGGLNCRGLKQGEVRQVSREEVMTAFIEAFDKKNKRRPQRTKRQKR
jgi:23S rRNA pseudouridine2605 synthase